MRVAFFGDVTGAAAVDHLCNGLPSYREAANIDVVIVNADNTAITGPHPFGGSGTTIHHCRRLREAGCDVVTTGSHALDGPESDLVHRLPYVIRPANVHSERGGKGWIHIRTASAELTVAAIALGNHGGPAQDPWEIWQTIPKRGHIVLHLIGEPHEVRVFAHRIDGEVSVVFGTLGHEASRHHYQLPEGTLLVPDVGMVGPKAGVGGFSPEWTTAKKGSTVEPYHLMAGKLICDGIVATIDNGEARLERIPPSLKYRRTLRKAVEAEFGKSARTMLRIGVIADPHIDLTPPRAISFHNQYCLEESAELFRRAIERLRNDKVDIIAVLGDVTDRGDRPAFEAAIEMVQDVDRPIYLLPGNHDVGDGGSLMREIVAAVSQPWVEQGPFQAQRMSGGLTLAAMDLEASPNPWIGQSRNGLPGPCDGDDLLLMLTHYPLCSTQEFLMEAGFRHPGDLADFEVCERAADNWQIPSLILSGHLHFRGEWARGKRLQMNFAALIEPPHDVSVVVIERTAKGIAVERQSVSVRPYTSDRLPVSAPAQSLWHLIEGCWTLAEKRA